LFLLLTIINKENMGYIPHVEPMPEVFNIPGDLLISPGGSFIYEVLSYPLCRLYHDNSPDAKFPLQPHAFEGLTPEDRKAGRKANYLSYLVRIYKGRKEFYITDRNFKKVIPVVA
jgi:hypothetical protein